MKTQPYYIVRTSKIHGKGVFAKRPIRKGVQIIEYTGEIISSKKADKLGSTIDENGHGHTMMFKVDDDRVINGMVGGPAKYINHSCAPNAEAVQYDDKIFIEALRSIKTGEEITYDYNLQIPGKITKKVKKEYACFCGSPNCRGTQIAPEILEEQTKKDEKKRLKKEKKKEKKRAEKELKAKKKAEKKLKKKADKKSEKKDKTKKSKVE